MMQVLWVAEMNIVCRRQGTPSSRPMRSAWRSVRHRRTTDAALDVQAVAENFLELEK